MKELKNYKNNNKINPKMNFNNNNMNKYFYYFNIKSYLDLLIHYFFKRLISYIFLYF